jgi:ArsR family transcriptional regulator
MPWEGPAVLVIGGWMGYVYAQEIKISLYRHFHGAAGVSSPRTIGLDALLAALRASGDETRLRLLALLKVSDLNVKDLTRILGQSQPRISRHLKLLNEAGLVDRFREGSWVYYRIAEGDGRAELADDLVARARPADPVLARDRERLEEVKRGRAEEAAAYFKANAVRWDQLRSLHIPEDAVEEQVLQALGAGPFRRLLDLGTGTGRMLELLAPRVQRGMGIDLSHEMLGFARANLEAAGVANCHVRHGDLYNLPFEPKSFDAITIHQVLHYLEDPDRAIAEAGRVLAPGGRMVIVDFAPHELEFLRDEHAHRRLGLADRQMQRWLAKAGLELASRVDLEAPPSAGETLTVSIWQARAPGGAKLADAPSAQPLEVMS